MNEVVVAALVLSHFTVTSCLGSGIQATLKALWEGHSGLAPCRFESADLATFVGEVPGVDAVELPRTLAAYNCRNNRLAELGLAQDGFEDAVRTLIGRYGSRRVGLFLGTSTSGILQTEQAYRRRDRATGALPADFHYATTHNPFSVTDYVRRRYGLEGPAASVSTACSSAAKVFGNARRMIDAGLIDAAIVGGVDSLCLTTLYGFNALELLSDEPCRPFDVNRKGISIGEAAAFIILEPVPESLDADALLLRGVGESSDAYHMSSPHPEGLGARRAMEQALADAGLAAASIDYINLHGTATPSNDAAEARAVRAVFGDAVPCSSTKGATGHTLGAAGGVEAVVTALSLRAGLLPGSPNTQTLDPTLVLRYLCKSGVGRPLHAVSNSFGFGGSNCSLVLGVAG